MKKVVLAIIALLYLVSASGVVVDIHYCMEQFAEKDNCCDTQTKWIKLQDAHQHVKLPKQFKQLNAEAGIPQFTVADRVMTAGQHYSLQYIAPPNQKVNAIYLHNCVFRI